VENQDLWQRLLRLTNIHAVTWHKVKGHSDNQNNNRCDTLARDAIKALQNEKLQNEETTKPDTDA